MGITITETRVQDQSSAFNNIEDIINVVYPVGSIYISVNSTSPASLFGGTWEQIKDRFLLASGDTYSAGSTGGEAQHKLTMDEMPSHRHSSDSYQLGYSDSGLVGQGGYCTWVNKGTKDNNSPNTAESGPVKTSFVGGSQPHNNMPPYLTVYVWKRVADEDFVVLSLQNGRLVMYRSKVSQYGINFILSNHKNLIVMHTDKVNFDIVDHQRLEVEYL